MERRLVTGVTCSKDDAQVTLRGVKNVPGVAAMVFGPLGDAEVNVDMIVQNVGGDGQDATDITFTVPKVELEKATEALKSASDTTDLEYDSLATNSNVVKVSVIGVGMATNSGVAQKMFTVLAEKGINILVITTSEIKISVLIDAEYVELAMRTLHNSYGLDKE